MIKKPIVAIDGPAGSGKSTIAKLVAKKLGLFYIDTGAMYRALALKAKKENIDPKDHAKIAKLAENLDVKLIYDKTNGDLSVFLDGEDVSSQIRKPDVTKDVSPIAMIKEVREFMVALQRKMAEGKKSILEGRDIATVVFPDAYKKFFLDADPKERIKRRYLELKEKDPDITPTQIKNDIEKRDRIDTTREIAPLKRAEDAFYIDTTKLSIQEVADKILHEIEN